MKRTTLLLVITILLLVVSTIFLVVFLNTTWDNAPSEDESTLLETGEFSLDKLAEKYEMFFEMFSFDDNIGQIGTAEDAAQKAKLFLLNKFNGISEDADCFQSKWVRVDYDSQRMCWHIYNTTPKDCVGGIVHVFVYDNGDVISAFIED